MPTSADPFSQACGATAPIRLEVHHPDEPVLTAEVAKPFALIGRDPRADLNVPDPDVAARQLYLQLIGGRLFGVRLSDRAATSAAGRLWDSGWLRPGDEVTVKRVAVRVVATGRAPDGPPPDARPPAPT